MKERTDAGMEDTYTGIPIFRNEVELAGKKIKWRKSEGSDGIVVEIIEAVGEFAIDKLTDKANILYSTGTIPPSNEGI